MIEDPTLNVGFLIAGFVVSYMKNNIGVFNMMRLTINSMLFILCMLFSPSISVITVATPVITTGRYMPTVQFKSDKTELECLAKNIYFEARNEGITGMWAVANVTINRSRNLNFPNTICGVVFQKNQFSWTRNKQLFVMHEDGAADLALWIAELVLSLADDSEMDVTKGSTHFHASYVKPYWRKKLIKTVVVGSHLFYKEP